MRPSLSKDNVWGESPFVESYKFLEGLEIKQQLYRTVVGMIPDTADGATIVDLGCGMSSLLQHLPESSSYTYTGLDRSSQMLAAGEDIHGREINTVQGDITALPFRDSSATVVTAVNVLYLFDHRTLYDKILLELARIIKPGGYVIIANPLPDANNTKIILEELRLRAGGDTAGLTDQVMQLPKLISDIRSHRDFIKSQSKLLKGALKLTVDEWRELFELRGFTLSEFSLAYAGQASVICFQKASEV